jgi:hypothetical protein
MRFLPAMAGLVALLAVAACSNAPSEDDCIALLDKVVELEIHSAGTDKLPPAMKADLDQQRTQLKDFLSSRFMEQCQKNTSAKIVACGLEAKSKAEYAACDTK